MTKRVDQNLISLNLWAKQGNDSALSLEGNLVKLKNGKHQTGDDLRKVIIAVKEAVTDIDSFSLRLQGIDLGVVVADFKRRVDDFKRERREKLDTFGVVKSDDLNLDSALQQLVTAIAGKTIHSKL